jgi:hypothetical protein
MARDVVGFEIDTLQEGDLQSIVGVGGNREHRMQSFWAVLLDEQKLGSLLQVDGIP